jgi:hypothetical protein
LVSTFDFLSPGGHPIFVTRLPNQRDPKRPPINRYVRNETELQKFIADYDEPGYALYHAVAILEEGSWRNKANVRATRYIWTEVDFKDHPDFSAEEIRRRIESIPLKPTAVIFSGHGYHLYWQLREDVDAKPGEAQQQVEEALRLAVNYVGGDTQVAEAARLMRLPGSHNTRVAGEELPVVFDVLEMSRAYSLNELVDFFLEAVPILPPPAKKANGSGHDAGGFNFEAQEQPAGRVDAENELDAIHNGASANQVQCRVIPSLIWKAWHPNEIVRFVVDGTMQAAERAGLGWDRATEVEHVVARVLSAYHNMLKANMTRRPASSRFGCRANFTRYGPRFWLRADAQPSCAMPRASMCGGQGKAAGQQGREPRNARRGLTTAAEAPRKREVLNKAVTPSRRTCSVTCGTLAIRLPSRRLC